jgi:hypothetical protein
MILALFDYGSCMAMWTAVSKNYGRKKRSGREEKAKKTIEMT